MAKRYESDSVIEREVFGSGVDFDTYSAAQITDLLEKDFVDMALDHACHYDPNGYRPELDERL